MNRLHPLCRAFRWLSAPRARSLATVGASALLAWRLVLPASATSFQGLGDLAGSNFFSVAMAVSANGQVVVGYSTSTQGTEAFRWTATNGMVGLSDLPGGLFSSSANAVSADGAVVVGYGRSAAGTEAFRWTPATGMVGLGDLPGGGFASSAWGVSADGQVIVGHGRSAASGTRDEAFRWTFTNGMVGLGDLPGGNYSSRAWAVSGDGSVIVGESGSSNATSGVAEAFRWTMAGGMVPLGDLPSEIFNSIAYAVSADGSTVVGRGYPSNSSTHEAFYWTASNGLVPLGFIPCDDWSIAHAVSGDGSVIAGDPEIDQGDCAFIWDSRHGLRSLHHVLTNDYGLDLTGWQLSSVRGVSPDGHTLVGYGVNPAGQTEGWMATLKPPSLEIAHAGSQIILSWARHWPRFVLEYTSSLAGLGSWSTSSAPVYLVGDHFVVTNAVGAEQLFFRLRKP